MKTGSTDTPRKVGFVYAGLGVVIAGAMAGGFALAESQPVHYRDASIPDQACVTDDPAQQACFWDAGVRGNGHGHSFWQDKFGQRHYLDPTVRPDEREPYGGCDEQLQPGNRPVPTCMRQLGYEPFRNVEGHTGCWIKYGDTSTVRCDDGWVTRS